MASESGKAARPLKILMLAPTPFFSDRGCHVRIYEEAKALRERGHQVEIVTYHLGRDIGDIPVTRIANIPWYTKQSAGPSWHKLYLDILLFFKSWSVARRFRPDVLHAHLHEGALLATPLKWLLHIPLVFDYQGSLTGEMEDHDYLRRGRLLYKVFAGLERLIHRFSDRIVVSSGQSQTSLVEQWDIDELKVVRVIDAVDTLFFTPQDGAGIRKKFLISTDSKVVVFAGVLNEYQGIDLLLDAAVMLKENQLTLHFLIVGFPEEGYRAKASQMGLEGMVTFTGRIPYAEIPRYLGAGDIAVSPKVSTSEANLKLFNYMACGLPTVVFEAQVNREILADAGVYAKFGDAEDFSKVLADLAGDEGRLGELSQRSRRDAVEKHSWSARAEELEDLYFTLTGY